MSLFCITMVMWKKHLIQQNNQEEPTLSNGDCAYFDEDQCLLLRRTPRRLDHV